MRASSRLRWFAVLAVGTAAITVAGCSSSTTASHRPFPQVISQDGALLNPLRLATFIASNDQIDEAAFAAFSDGLGGSAWWRSLASEYRLGAVTTVAAIVGPPITSDITDHGVFDYITDAVAKNGGPERDGNTLYLMYLPPGISVISAGKINSGCATFGAYHAVFGTRGDNLAVVQRCTESFPIENMTISASHEIVESATDPTGTGYALPRIATREPWTESIWNALDLKGHAELGDLCESTFFESAGAVYQRVWSNEAAQSGGDPCIPALPEPYYDADFDQDWYAITPGHDISIPVRGWATGPVDRWPVAVRVDAAAGVSTFAATFSSMGGTLVAGERGELVVSASATALTGAFAVIRVASERPAPRAGARGMTDGAHSNFVGVYVP